MKTLGELTLDDRSTQELPADPKGVNSHRHVQEAYYPRGKSTPLRRPITFGWSREVAEIIRLNPGLQKA